MYYTYVITNPITNQPFYVGKGTGRRMYWHWMNRDTHANKFMRETLQAIERKGLKPLYEKVLINANETQASDKEQELIKHYGRRDLGTGILCNLTDGGDQGATSWSPETKERKRQIELAKKKGRPVSQFTLTGEHIADYTSAKVASECTNVNQSYITQVCKGKRVSAGKFLWTYKGENPRRFTKIYYRSVDQFTIDNKFIRHYISLTDAERWTNVELHNISECCRGKSKTAGGFIWKYHEPVEKSI